MPATKLVVCKLCVSLVSPPPFTKAKGAKKKYHSIFCLIARSVSHEQSFVVPGTLVGLPTFHISAAQAALTERENINGEDTYEDYEWKNSGMNEKD